MERVNTQDTTYSIDSGSEEDKVVGRIEVNSLNDLAPVYGYEIKPDPGVNLEEDNYDLKLGTDSKVFELVNLNDIGRVGFISVLLKIKSIFRWL